MYFRSSIPGFDAAHSNDAIPAVQNEPKRAQMKVRFIQVIAPIIAGIRYSFLLQLVLPPLIQSWLKSLHGESFCFPYLFSTVHFRMPQQRCCRHDVTVVMRARGRTVCAQCAPLVPGSHVRRLSNLSLQKAYSSIQMYH